MKKTKIIFLRHGEVDNKKKVLYGRLPGFKLSENGIESIEKAALRLKKFKIDLIYTSPMLRTRQTSAIFAQSLNLKPRISKLLNEGHIIFQGMPLVEYKKTIQFRLYSEEFIKKGQESVDSLASRMTKFADMIIRKHPQQTILAVSHGDPITVLKAITSGKDFTWDYKKNNYLKTGHWFTLELNGKICRWV